MPIDEPKALAADILSEIISYVKASRPTRTDGSSTQGFVYCQMRPGLMISPRDYSRAWSPMGTSSSPPASGATPPAGATPPGEVAGAAARRARQAATNMGLLCDELLVVTDDSTTVKYSGGGRRLDVSYPQLLASMECAPLPPQSPETQRRIAEAKAVLWDADHNETPEYARYLDNQLAYATARAAFTIEQDKILKDPERADSAPLLLAPLQTKVDRAYHKWKSVAGKIEEALAIAESEGVPLEQGMIARARQLLTAWSLPLSGIPDVNTPYTFMLPSEWSTIEVDDIGWTTLTRTKEESRSHYETHGYALQTGEWHGDSSSTSGHAGVGLFGFGFSGGYSSSSSSSGSDFSQTASDGTIMNSDASQLSVTLQYGLVRIHRPWLVTDLFRMRNWYLRGEKAHVISDGTIDNQKGKEEPLLPMLPTHFLVIRNVEIQAEHWGSVRDTMSSYWAKQQASSSSSSSSISGGVSIPVLGPFSLSGGFSHDDSHYQGDFKDEGGRDCRDDFGAFFDGETLRINGAQVVAVLGEIVPASPPIDDPSLSSDSGDR